LIQSSVADALFSRTQQRVLGLLFGEPGRSFYASEIMRRAAAGRGAVQRELQRLVSSGLVTVKDVGNQKHYRANTDAPIFNELRSIILKTSGLTDPIRQALKPIAGKIQVALIYGSVARGEAHAGSDVDLLVVAGDLSLERLFTRLAPAERAIGRTIHPTLYTPEEFRSRRQKNAFVKKLLAGPVIPLIGTIDGKEPAR